MSSKNSLLDAYNINLTFNTNIHRPESKEFDDWDCEGEGLSDDDSQDPPSTASTPDFSICDREAAANNMEVPVGYEEPHTPAKVR